MISAGLSSGAGSDLNVSRPGVRRTVRVVSQTVIVVAQSTL